MARSKKADYSNNSNVQEIFQRPETQDFSVQVKPELLQSLLLRLTDFYIDPVVSCVRELMSNAIDATISAGKDTPIEVTLPDMLSPFFTIRDYGCGMSLEAFVDGFQNYGSSLKIENINTIGKYGLGGKSPLAYADHFFIETVFDGQKIKAEMIRSSSGMKTPYKVSATDEPNGTTIRVPVVNSEIHFERFSNAMDTYRRFSYNIPVIIDGEKFFGNDDYTYLQDVIILEDEDETVYGKVWVNNKNVSDVFVHSLKGRNYYTTDFKPNIAYVLEGFFYDGENNKYSDDSSDFIVELKPEIVNFPSSRDSIINDDRFTAFKSLVAKTVNADNNELLSTMLEKTLAKLSTKDVIHMLNKLGYVLTDKEVIIAENKENLRYSRNLFTHADGSNIFVDYEQNDNSNCSAIFTINKSYYGISYGSYTVDKKFDAPFSTRWNTFSKEEKVSSVKSTMKKNYDNVHVGVADVLNESIREGFYIFVESVDKNTAIHKIVTDRARLVNFDREYTHVVPVRGVLSDFDKKLISQVLGEGKYVFKDISQFVTKTTPAPRDRVVYEIFGRYIESFASQQEILETKFAVFEDKRVNIKEHEDNNGLFIVTDSYSSENVLTCLNGFYTVEPKKALNRPIMVVIRPKVNFFNSVNLKNIIFDKSFVAKSVTAKKASENRVFDRSRKFDLLEVLSASDAFKILVKFDNRYINFTTVANKIDSFANDLVVSDDLLKIRDAITKAVNDESVSFNRDVITINELEKHLEKLDADLTKLYNNAKIMRDALLYSNNIKINALFKIVTEDEFSHSLRQSALDELTIVLDEGK